MRLTLLLCAVLNLAAREILADEPATATETVVRFDVEPSRAPKPALKYQLLPELRELEPGNPVQGYMKCFMESWSFWYDKEVYLEREKWLAAPLAELPLDKLYGYDHGELRQADLAARLDNPDWQILLPAKREGPVLGLPEVQTLRALGGALRLRFRVEIAERRFDDAVKTAKTIFALARHFGEHPSVIGNLVGTAIASETVPTLEEMLRQPGCPNLFWALTDLPSPLIDIRRGVQRERLIMMPLLADFVRDRAMDEAELERVISRLMETLNNIAHFEDRAGLPAENARAWLKGRAGDKELVAEARQRLIETGLAPELVEHFPALQVALLEEQRVYEERHDEVMKWMNLPYWQAEPGLLAATKTDRMPLHAAEPDRPDKSSLFGLWSPRMAILRTLPTRLDQRLALLRVLEALRLHAAEHDGRLPADLNEVDLPLPVDPFTGQPFNYRLEGETATLHGATPRGLEKDPTYNVRYQITIKK